MLAVAADKAFHSWINTFEFYTLDFDPLVLKQGSKPETVGHNALIWDAGYFQRWMAETPYSSVKRSLGSSGLRKVWILTAPMECMSGTRRFDVIEHLSEAELDTAINEAQKADEARLSAVCVS